MPHLTPTTAYPCLAALAWVALPALLQFVQWPRAPVEFSNADPAEDVRGDGPASSMLKIHSSQAVDCVRIG